MHIRHLALTSGVIRYSNEMRWFGTPAGKGRKQSLHVGQRGVARKEKKKKSICFSLCYRIKNKIRSVQYCFTINLSTLFMYCRAVRQSVVGCDDERNTFYVLY